MKKVVGVKFFDTNRIYYFAPNGNIIKENDYVIVETERGLQIGKSISDILELEDDKVFLPLKNVIRLANKKDIKINKKNIDDAKEALEYAKKLVDMQKVNMKLFDASYTFDKSKLIFKFISDERIDFRDIVKLLASKYKTRIELRQIGVRDKAKEIGGIGPCGMKLCCSRFLSNFDSVSINMAKNQGIALNPTKINGSCGRLLCCLSYEDDIYTEYKKELPKIGETVNVQNKTGKVIELDVINKKYKIKTDEEEFIVEV